MQSFSDHGEYLSWRSNAFELMDAPVLIGEV